MKSRNEKQFEKISELLGLDKMEKGIQLYIREVFNTDDGSTGDRVDLILGKLGVDKLDIEKQDIISEKLEMLVEMYDSDKPIDEDTMRQVEFFKWDNIAESVKKPTTINMKDWKWTKDGYGGKVNESSPYGSDYQQMTWNLARRIYINNENIVQHSNNASFPKGKQMSLNDIKRLKETGTIVVYTQ